VGRSRPHRRTRYWARRCGRSRPGLSVGPCLRVGPQRDPVRGPHLVTVRGLVVDNGPIARTSRSAQLAWTFRSARIGIVRTIACGPRRLFPPWSRAGSGRHERRSAIDFHRAPIYFPRIVVAVLATHPPYSTRCGGLPTRRPQGTLQGTHGPPLDSWRGRSTQEHPREVSAPRPDLVAGRSAITPLILALASPSSRLSLRSTREAGSRP
jgi:hypothetical protein